MYVHEPNRVYMHRMCASMLGGQKRVLGSLKLELIGSFEPPRGRWDLNPCPSV